MKKLMALALGTAFAFTTLSVAFAQDSTKTETTKKESTKKKGKKGTTTKTEKTTETKKDATR
jgi:hypothetical protein